MIYLEVMKTDYSKKYLRKARLFAALLQLTPFVRAVFLTGSLAQGKAKQSSDIDFLIVAKSGRIFTTRFLSVLSVLILGQKRPKDETRSHVGKFCLNHFLTDNYLKIPMDRGQDINNYCAKNFQETRVLWEDGHFFDQFVEQNPLIFRSSRSLNHSYHTKIKNILIFEIWQRFVEMILGGKLGLIVENKLKTYQIRSIENDSRTGQYPDLIVYNDQEMRFQPPKSEINCSI